MKHCGKFLKCNNVKEQDRPCGSDLWVGEKRPQNSPLTQHRERKLRKCKRKIGETEERSKSFNISLIRVQKGQNRENGGKVVTEEIMKLRLSQIQRKTLSSRCSVCQVQRHKRLCLQGCKSGQEIDREGSGLLG